MNHSISTPENGSTSDIDFLALMNFEPEITIEQLKVVGDIFNKNAVFVRVAFSVLTKTPQQLVDGCRDDPEVLDSLLENLEITNNYVQSLSQLVSTAYHRLVVVGGYMLQTEGGAA